MMRLYRICIWRCSCEASVMAISGTGHITKRHIALCLDMYCWVTILRELVQPRT